MQKIVANELHLEGYLGNLDGLSVLRKIPSISRVVLHRCLCLFYLYKIYFHRFLIIYFLAHLVWYIFKCVKYEQK